MYCYYKCSVAVPHGAVGWSAVCDCGISWSYTFTFFLIWSGLKPNKVNPSPQWCSRWNLILIGQLVSEIFMFESVDAQTDRHWLESHPIRQPQAFASGELNINNLLLVLFIKIQNFSLFAPIQNHSYPFWHRAIYTSNNKTNWPKNSLLFQSKQWCKHLILN